MKNSRQTQKRVTLHDVARRAKVSQISVSRVMRGEPNISQALRKNVLEAAEALGYTPNRLAGALKTQSSNLVAVVVPSISNAVFPEVIDGIDSVLSNAGLQPVLGITHYNQERETQIIRDLLSWSPMGIILAGTDLQPAVMTMLNQQRLPIVQMMDIDGDAMQVAVGMSHKKAAEAVANHVVEKGYQRIGYIGAWGEKPDRSRIRRLAFEAHLKKLGCPLTATLIRDENSSIAIGQSAMQALLSQHPDLDCVFFANDDLAVGAMLYCLAENIKIPEQVGLVGFNGIDIGQALPIQLTTVQLQRFKMGTETAKALLALQHGEQIPAVHDLGFKLIKGMST